MLRVCGPACIGRALDSLAAQADVIFEQGRPPA
jgi:hypothetical protein